MVVRIHLVVAVVVVVDNIVAVGIVEPLVDFERGRIVFVRSVLRLRRIKVVVAVAAVDIDVVVEHEQEHHQELHQYCILVVVDSC